MNALIAARADLNKARDDGATPLYKAAQEGHIEVVNALLRAGANQNLATDNGLSPLSVAQLNGHTEVVQALEAAAIQLEAPGEE